MLLFTVIAFKRGVQDQRGNPELKGRAASQNGLLFSFQEMERTAHPSAPIIFPDTQIYVQRLFPIIHLS